MAVSRIIESNQEIPKYVEKDLEIIYNYEFDEDERYNGETDHRMARKLFSIAKNYPQKHLWAILEYFGYYFDEHNIDDEDRIIRYLEPKDYRNQILHMAEEHFKDAMDKFDEMYDPYNNRWNEDEHTHHIERQSYFINKVGLIDCWYKSKENFKKYVYKREYYTGHENDPHWVKNEYYEYKYPQMIDYRECINYKYILLNYEKSNWNEISFARFHDSEYYKIFVNGEEWKDDVMEYDEIAKLLDEFGIDDIEHILNGNAINIKDTIYYNQFTRYYDIPKIESIYI